MSHEGGADNSQRTVAELLAKYGADSGERAPRRRRRRDDSEDTGAQAIIDRVMSESGEMAPIREDTPPPDRTPRRHRTGYQRPVEPPPPQRQVEPPPPPRPVDPPPSPSPTRRRQPVQPLPPQPAAPPPPQPQPRTEYTRPVGPPSSGRIPAIARSSEPTTPVRETRRQLPPQPPPRQQTSQRLPVPPPPPPPQVEPTTEELPRMPARLPANDSHSRLAPAPYPDSDPDTGFEDEQDGRDYDDYDRGDYPRDDYDQDYDRDDYNREFDLDEDLDDRELDDDEPREKVAVSPAREWLVLAGQLALGVLGGAAVWLGFNWLWGFLPQAALVAALGVIVGMVLIVRKLRRAEDLMTTVLTVLVGLIVTVSPAPLLLIYQ